MTGVAVKTRKKKNFLEERIGNKTAFNKYLKELGEDYQFDTAGPILDYLICDCGFDTAKVDGENVEATVQHRLADGEQYFFAALPEWMKALNKHITGNFKPDYTVKEVTCVLRKIE